MMEDSKCLHSKEIGQAVVKAIAKCIICFINLINVKENILFFMSLRLTNVNANWTMIQRSWRPIQYFEFMSMTKPEIVNHKRKAHF